MPEVAGGARTIVGMALRGTSWSHLLDYASPALFDVIPARALLAQSRELLANHSNSERFSHVRERIGTVLRERSFDVQLLYGATPNGEVPLTELAKEIRSEIGQRILGIFFTQLFAEQEALLDLRAEKFAVAEGGVLHWRPGALYIHWQPEFLDGVRELYRGFYLQDDTRFDAGLQQLNMAGSGDTLRNLLGRDDPRNIRFDIDTFHANFHELFVSYRDRGVPLHRNFLPLGICLMCLYATLDSLDVPLDVRAVVEQAQ